MFHLAKVLVSPNLPARAKPHLSSFRVRSATKPADLMAPICDKTLAQRSVRPVRARAPSEVVSVCGTEVRCGGTKSWTNAGTECCSWTRPVNAEPRHGLSI